MEDFRDQLKKVASAIGITPTEPEIPIENIVLVKEEASPTQTNTIKVSKEIDPKIIAEQKRLEEKFLGKEVSFWKNGAAQKGTVTKIYKDKYNGIHITFNNLLSYRIRFEQLITVLN